MKGRILILIAFLFSLSVQAQLYDTTAIMQEIRELGSNYMNDLENSKVRYESLRQRLLKMDFDKGKLLVLRGLGNVHYIKGEYNDALSHYLKAVNLATSFKNMALEVAKLNYNIALTLFAQKEYLDAERYIQKSIELTNGLDGDDIVRRNINLKGNIRYHLNQFEEARKLYEEVYLKAAAVQDTFNMLNALIISSLFPQVPFEEQTYAEILAKLDPFMPSDDSDLNFAYTSIKLLYLGHTDLPKALKMIPAFAKKAEVHMLQNDKKDAYLAIAMVYRLANNYPKAKEYLQACEKLINDEEDFKLEILYPEFVTVEEALGNYAAAYNYSKKYAELKRKLTSMRNEQLIASINLKYRSSEKDNEILAQKMKIQEQKSKLMERQFKFTSSIIGLVLVGLFVFCYFLYNDAKQKTNYNKFLKEHNAKLQEADATKSKFIDSITHELRTPLYTITGLVELLRTADNDREKSGYLRTLSFSNNYLSNFIDNMISLNSGEKDAKLQLECKEINLEEVVKGVTNSVRIIGTSNKIIEQIDQRLPVTILGDQLKVSQILFNLVNNANKFTTKGLVWLRLLLEDISEDTVRIRFEVEDNGIGIEKDNQEKVFDHFFRGQTSSGKHYNGTGIGLSVVRNFVELHGSRVYLDSEVGKGTKFYFSLTFDLPSQRPLSIKESTIEVAQNSFTDAQQEEGAMEDDKLTILLVEDNRINQMIVQKIILNNGWNCEIAKNGKIAVEMVHNNNYDLILMDIMMPVMNGFEATREIKKFNTTVPILALTAVSKSEHEATFKELGIEVVISKPVDPPQLLEIITNHLLNRNATL